MQCKYIRPRKIYAKERASRRSELLKLKSQSANKASLRMLPFPFYNYFSISSDADSPSMEGFESTGEILRNKYGLPIADSIFPHYLFNHGLCNKLDRKITGLTGNQFLSDRALNAEFNFEQFMEGSANWIKRFYQGWTDVVHGWLLRINIRIGNDVVFSAKDITKIKNSLSIQLKQTIKNGLIRLILKENVSEGIIVCINKKITFKVPEGWHNKVPPRYLVFLYRNPVAGVKVVFKFMDQNKLINEIDISEVRDGSPEVLSEYIIDLYDVIGFDAELLKRIQVDVVVTGISPVVDIRSPTMVSWLREDIEDQAQVFSYFNLDMTTYTSHGGGYNIGHNKSYTLESSDPRGHAENINSPFYALDLFKKSGINFFNSASNTSQRKVLSINDLLFPRSINDDSTVLYDFHRFFHIPSNNDGTDNYSTFEIDGVVHDVSLSTFAGIHINALLDNANEYGQGGIIYTHFMAKPGSDPNRKDRSVSNIFNGNTHQALNRLSDSYFGMENKRRTWVVSVSTLLRYAQVMKELPNYSSYDRITNTITIKTWVDPITSKKVSCSEEDYRQLRFCTFYVEDSSSATIIVDGETVKTVIRNPADETGKESIAIADIYTPTVILGKKSIDKREDIHYQMSGIRLTSEDNKENGSLLTLTENQAQLVLSSNEIKFTNHQYVYVQLKGDFEKISCRIEFENEEGQILSMVCKNYPEETSNAYPLIHDVSNPDQTWVVPFYQMVASLNNKCLCPVGKVKEIRLLFFGDVGEKVQLKKLYFLRDDDKPARKKLIVGGEILSGSMVTSVIAKVDKRKYSATVLNNGFFWFSEKFSRNATVEIEGFTSSGECILPENGKWQEITRDTMDINFI